MPTPQWADLYAVKNLRRLSRTPKATVIFIAENYYFSSIFLIFGGIFQFTLKSMAKCVTVKASSSIIMSQRL